MLLGCGEDLRLGSPRILGSSGLLFRGGTSAVGGGYQSEEEDLRLYTALCH